MKAFIAGIVLAAAMTFVSTAWGACRNLSTARALVDGGLNGGAATQQLLGQSPEFCFDITLSSDARGELEDPIDAAIAAQAAPHIRNQVNEIAQAGRLLARHSPINLDRIQFKILDPYGDGNKQQTDIVETACDPADARVLCLSLKPEVHAAAIQDYLVTHNRMQAISIWGRIRSIGSTPPESQAVQIADDAQAKLIAGDSGNAVTGVQVAPGGGVSMAK